MNTITMLTHPPLQDLFTRSRWLTLDFSQISPDTPNSQNMQRFFEQCEQEGVNPRLPEQRQRFNNRVLQETGARYLVSQYGEDRTAMLAGSSIAREGRTLHLGVDIFCRELEVVYAPCDGEIVQTGRERQGHSFGYYIVIKPTNADYYVFLGHMSAKQPELGPIRAGEAVGRLGDFVAGENGGWSRHLHVQLLKQLPPGAQVPLGYSTQADIVNKSTSYPNPLSIFPNWQII